MWHEASHTTSLGLGCTSLDPETDSKNDAMFAGSLGWHQGPTWTLAPCSGWSQAAELSGFFFFFCLFRAAPTVYRSYRLGVELELQLLAYATATAMWDPSSICDLHHSSRQCWILNPLRKARDWTCILMDTSWVGYRGATMGTPELSKFYFPFFHLPLLC